MKILCLYKDCGEAYRLSGFGNTLIACGHKFVFWRPQDKPAFDAFSEFEPDLFIGTTFDLDRATIKCLNERPHTKAVLKGGNWGELDSQINKKLYPIVFAGDDDKKVVEQLNTPPHIMCHYFPSRLRDTMIGWQEIVGDNILCVPNAADILDYGLGTFRPELESDISYIGGAWGYKNRNLHKFLLPLLYPVGNFNVKIWGNQGWNGIPQFLGYVETPIVKDIIRSAKVCPSISEPHSVAFGFDVIERPYKIASAGGLCVSDRVSSLSEDVFTDDEIDFFDTPVELEDLVEWYTTDVEMRYNKANRQRQTVLAKHTYFHRVSDLFTQIGMKKEADDVLDIYRRKYYAPSVDSQ